MKTSISNFVTVEVFSSIRCCQKEYAFLKGFILRLYRKLVLLHGNFQNFCDLAWTKILNELGMNSVIWTMPIPIYEESFLLSC